MTKEQLAVKLIVMCEGERLTAYQDSIGRWTIGNGTTRYPNGIAVKEGDTCTYQEMETWTINHLQKNVFPLLTKWNVPDRVYASLASFAYNEGHIWDDIKAVLNVSPLDLNALARAFMNHTIAGGKPVLARRRAIEIKFWEEN